MLGAWIGPNYLLEVLCKLYRRLSGTTSQIEGQFCVNSNQKSLSYAYNKGITKYFYLRAPNAQSA